VGSGIAHRPAIVAGAAAMKARGDGHPILRPGTIASDSEKPVLRDYPGGDHAGSAFSVRADGHRRRSLQKGLSGPVGRG
jgi:hypothetical protein